MIEYTGHKILVTGASSGIGQNLAIALADRDNQVILCARDREKLEQTLEQMKNPGQHKILPMDVTHWDEYQNLFDEAVLDGRKLDGLVHCAGIANPTPIRMLNDKMISETLNTNYVSFLCLVRMFAKKKYADSGSIVALSSINTH